uniref:hypothetical protein n=1 Tax=Ningiella ruwaisensis TaxID=2364274 RepID=UPI0010A0B1DF|nr:hypothetical protein [Ningiella ruwaisensis]
MNLYTYAPICLPLNWQSELLSEKSERFRLIKTLVNGSNKVEDNPWPVGYGSLSHDNLPVLYQVAATITLCELEQEDDVKKAQLYCFDNCLAVLFIHFYLPQSAVNANKTKLVDDAAISARVEALSKRYISPICESLYAYKGGSKLIAPAKYTFFKDDRKDLVSAKPLWVARAILKDKQCEMDKYKQWLENIDESSDMLLLGSGNSLILNAQDIVDVHRVMVLSQFHAALMARVEEILKNTLRNFNAAYFDASVTKEIRNDLCLHQQRNDHIEFIGIQYSAAGAGMQGKRRLLFQQFEHAWQFSEQQSRIEQLSNLIQQRLNRLMNEQFSRQNRAIQTLLAFLGALSLLGLVVDLASLHADSDHDKTYGILDIFQLVATENILNITIIVVVILTLYFYRNHE